MGPNQTSTTAPSGARSGEHTHLDQPNPDHDDDLLYLDPATGRWRHTLCHIDHRKETTTN